MPIKFPPRKRFAERLTASCTFYVGLETKYYRSRLIAEFSI